MLTGHLRYLLDRLIAGGLAGFSLIYAFVALLHALTPGGGPADVTGPLLGASVPALLLLVTLATMPKIVANRCRRATELLLQTYTA
jgi:hypothetical protein